MIWTPKNWESGQSYSHFHSGIGKSWMTWASGLHPTGTVPRSELVQSLGDRHGATLEMSLDLSDPTGRIPWTRPIP